MADPLAAPLPPTYTADGPTPDTHAKLVRAFRLGATIKIATGAAGVSLRVYDSWIQRGRAELAIDPGGAVTTPLARLAMECDEARHRGDVELLASVRAQATGIRCRTCQGEGTVRGHQVDGGGAGGRRYPGILHRIDHRIGGCPIARRLRREED